MQPSVQHNSTRWIGNRPRWLVYLARDPPLDSVISGRVCVLWGTPSAGVRAESTDTQPGSAIAICSTR